MYLISPYRNIVGLTPYLSIMQISPINEQKIREVEQYLVANLENRLKMTDLIRHFHLSETFIKKGFRILFKTTIHQYHMKKSMEYADAELKDGHAIKVIAIRFGYKYPRNFARAFKNVHQVAPQESNRNHVLQPVIKESRF